MHLEKVQLISIFQHLFSSNYRQMGGLFVWQLFCLHSLRGQGIPACNLQPYHKQTITSNPNIQYFLSDKLSRWMDKNVSLKEKKKSQKSNSCLFSIARFLVGLQLDKVSRPPLFANRPAAWQSLTWPPLFCELFRIRTTQALHFCFHLSCVRVDKRHNYHVEEGGSLLHLLSVPRAHADRLLCCSVLFWC